MFKWFQPQCPLGTREKAWTETRFAELAELVGMPRIHSAEVLLPTTDFFPAAFEPPPFVPARFLRRVANYLQLDVGEPRVQVVDDEGEQSLLALAGDWHEPVVRVRASLLSDAEALIAAEACELSRIFLARKGFRRDDAESLWLAELLPVLLGAGVFVANAVIHERIDRDTATRGWFVMQRRGNLPARMLGYALALFAWARNETPGWGRYLRLDASQPLADGLRFLQRTGDSLFRPEGTPADVPPSAAETQEQLQHGTPSQRMAALWRVAEAGRADAATEAAVLRCARDRDGDLRAAAFATLAALNVSNEGVADALQVGLGDGDEDVRLAAVRAVGVLRPPSKAVIDDLAFLLEDSNPEFVEAAALALGQYGRLAEPRLDYLLAALRRGLVTCQEAVVQATTEALCAVAADPACCVAEKFSHDGELLDMAVRALRAYGPS